MPRTALLAGTVALVQPDIKRVLAYSTVSQLGYMFLACGIGAYQAAVFMVIAHACYKGTLFLGAGSVIHGNEDNQDLRRWAALRRFMPFTAFAFILAWLAIAGIPPLLRLLREGRDHLGQRSSTATTSLWIVAVVAAAITAIYMTRETLLTFFGNERFRAALGADPVAGGTSGRRRARRRRRRRPWRTPRRASTRPTRSRRSRRPSTTAATGPGRGSTHDPHEMPWTMVVPSIVLALLAVVIGFINLPFTNFEFLTEWLDPVFRGVDRARAQLLRAGCVARRRVGHDRLHRHLLRLDDLPARSR